RCGGDRIPDEHNDEGVEDEVSPTTHADEVGDVVEQARKNHRDNRREECEDEHQATKGEPPSAPARNNEHRGEDHERRDQDDLDDQLIGFHGAAYRKKRSLRMLIEFHTDWPFDFEYSV